MSLRTAERTLATLLLRFWLPAAAYAALVLFVGSRPHLRPPIAFAMSDKVMHALEYLGLGVLLMRAARATWGAKLPAALVALCLGIMIGTYDELQQAHVPGRSSSGFDLMADAVGVALAPLVIRAFVRD
jgi:VanZ family protein